MKKNNQKAVGIGILLLLILIGVFFLFKKENVITLETVSANVPYNVRVIADTFTPIVGQNVDIQFEVRLNGKPANLEAGKIYPKATIASANLADVWLYHVDELTKTAPGVYSFAHTFTQPTEYTVWIENNNNTTLDHHGKTSEYIGKFTFQVQGDAAAAAPAPEKRSTIAKSFVEDGSYTLEVLPYSLSAGKTGSISVVAKKGGKEVALLPHFDHFYILTSPQENFYVLDHPIMNEKGATKAVVPSLTFPKAGRYALWIRLFPDNGSGTVTDIAEGTLVLEVK